MYPRLRRSVTRNRNAGRLVRLTGRCISVLEIGVCPASPPRAGFFRRRAPQHQG